jgi:hypothetical protein
MATNDPRIDILLYEPASTGPIASGNLVRTLTMTVPRTGFAPTSVAAIMIGYIIDSPTPTISINTKVETFIPHIESR